MKKEELTDATRDYVERLNEATQEKAIAAISDLRRKGLPWLWIQIALEQKEPSDWERWGFGLIFRDTFKAQVDKKHDAAKRALKNNDSPQTPNSNRSIGDAESYCLENSDILLSLLGCGSWDELKCRISAIKGDGQVAFDTQDAPPMFYYVAYSDGSEPVGMELPYDVSRFHQLPAICDVPCFRTDEMGRHSFYHSWAIHYDCRNADAIRFALAKGHIPAEYRRGYAELLERLDRGENYTVPVVYCRP